MIFAKKEVIELSGGEKYIVVDSLNEDNIWYYYICEVNKDETKLEDNFKIITTVSENGNLFIKTIKGDKYTTIEKIFKEKLQID
ncbi:MAG: hypothetical protein J1F35_07965 [Erysipelotrichales bacterium]|nr:hypothetical protein [Erysipelotrichales bacterium]